MIAGMVPIALGIGAVRQTRSPMAMAVIGGLMTSTLLTLVVIPVVFTYIDGLQIWIFNPMRGTGKKGRAIDSVVDNWAIETIVVSIVGGIPLRLTRFQPPKDLKPIDY